MATELFSLNTEKEERPKSLVVKVRVKTEFYKGKDGSANYKKVVRPLVRQSEEGALMAFTDDITEMPERIRDIVNLFDVEDGYYDMVPINICHDWETGIIEDWEYKLYK